MGHTIPMSTSIARGSVCPKKTDRRNGDFPRGQGASDRSDSYRKREPVGGGDGSRRTFHAGS